jgi:hypothetical protein
MALLFFIIIIGVAIFLIYFYKTKSNEVVNRPVETSITVTTTEQDAAEDIARKAMVDKIRHEIRASVKNHDVAVKALMSLSRIDGTTSEAERRIVFSFLQRMGEKLNEDTHWPYFNDYHAGEWFRAITLDEMDNICRQLQPMPLNYRIMVAASAQALVATGGTPKKSERAALEKIMSILTETKK